jgi:hypothetical protein
MEAARSHGVWSVTVSIGHCRSAIVRFARSPIHPVAWQMSSGWTCWQPEGPRRFGSYFGNGIQASSVHRIRQTNPSAPTTNLVMS